MPSRKTRNAHVGRQKVLSQHFRTASSRPLISAAVYAMTPLTSISMEVCVGSVCGGGGGGGVGVGMGVWLK